MKNILITGKGSYIGLSLEKWLSGYSGKYSIASVDMRDEQWKEYDFSKIDAVFHVAGIAHVSADQRLESLYYKVNRDLAIETAKHAKASGVKQFIFMSSIIVYGSTNTDNGMIRKDTVPKPDNFYGNSKLMAEVGIRELESDEFKVVILRPPMIYGKGSKGNYRKLSIMAQRIPVFPKLYNQRSMLYIDNLCEFIRLMIDNEEKGIFFPQNYEYVATSDMVRAIAQVHGKKVGLTKLFNPMLKLLQKRNGIVNKLFGSLAYEKSMSSYLQYYQVKDFQKSIEETEDF